METHLLLFLALILCKSAFSIINKNKSYKLITDTSIIIYLSVIYSINSLKFYKCLENENFLKYLMKMIYILKDGGKKVLAYYLLLP